MGIVLVVGVTIFGLLIYSESGIDGFYNVPSVAWYWIILSGVSNKTGFFFQVQGLRMTSAVQATLIAVSQMLVLSLIGWFCFGEVLTHPLIMLGLGLTVYGVFMSAKPEGSK
jgi:drug/metabolite transporter (DMT)-like permease